MHYSKPNQTTAWFLQLAFLFPIGLFLLAGISQSQEPPVILTTLDGEKVEGTVQQIDLDSITILTNDKEAKFQFDKIEKISTGIEPKEAEEFSINIRLIDGSSFAAKSFDIKSRKLTAQLFGVLKFEIDTRNVNAVRFKTYENQLELGKQWREILEDDSREGDCVVVNKSNELNAIEGIVGETKESKLGFSIGDRTAMVAFEKIDAILFYHASGRELPSPICNVKLNDGSELSARRLNWSESKLVVTSVSGDEIKLPLGAVANLDFSMGRSELLSNFEPSTNDWQALLTSSAIMEKLRRLKIARVNKSFKGEPLSLKFFTENELSHLAEIKQFENGFAMQAGGKLAFSLNGQFNRLQGWAGFDPKANGSGNVKFVVLADGKPLIERVLIHRTMKQPIKLDLDLKDVKRIVFQVDYQDGRSTGDQIHLVDLRVSQ